MGKNRFDYVKHRHPENIASSYSNIEDETFYDL